MTEPEALPFVKAFVSACEPLKDLPDQNGDEDWFCFHRTWSEIQSRGIDMQVFMDRYVSMDLKQSPLFELLFGPPPTIRLPTTFSTAPHVDGPFFSGESRSTSGKVEVKFTARDLIDSCQKLDNEMTTNGKFVQTPSIDKLRIMIGELCRKRVNVLEFLSNEMTDQALVHSPFFRLVVHTLKGAASHVIVNWDDFDWAMIEVQDLQGEFYLGSLVPTPVYPPNEHDTPFSPFDLRQTIIKAEATLSEVSLAEYALPESISFDVLHCQVEILVSDDINFSDFMAGYEIVEPEPGSLVYKWLINSQLGMMGWELFLADVVTNGDGEAYLDASYATFERMEDDSGLLTQEEAVSFVDALQEADVASIPRDSIRCNHCWSDFDEVEEGVNNLPVHLPCDSRHMLGRDCLIAILTSTGPLCPLCRVDIVALGP
jgi:hypothetical protein